MNIRHKYKNIFIVILNHIYCNKTLEIYRKIKEIHYSRIKFIYLTYCATR